MSEDSGTVPGERLRAERERRGFSTQKVAEQLHVDLWVVEALESGRHASLGAPVYVKGHLRKYATLLGLDAESLVSACSEQADPPLVFLKPATRSRRRMRVPWKALLIGAALLVIGAAAMWGYRIWRERSVAPPQAVLRPAASTQPAFATTAAVVSPANEPAMSQGQVQTPTPTRERLAPPALTTPARAQPSVRVRLSFSADSWVELYDANQRRVFFDLGVANSARSFTVAAPARVFLGYADAVQLELDGRPVTLVEEVRRGNVAHFTIDARGRLKPAGSLTGR